LSTRSKYFVAVVLLAVLVFTLCLSGVVLHVPAQTVENSDNVEDDALAFVGRRGISALELEELKRRHGVREEGRNYNLIINGHGTGLRPPTDKEWMEIADKAYVVESILFSQPAESPLAVDLSVTPWFPPIGTQDGEGSCVAWAVGYYTKTFQEAREHGWDLSGAAWIGGYYGYPTPAYQDRIFSPDFIYHLVNWGVDEGSYFYDAVKLVCTIGASSWEKMPYDALNSSRWPSEEAWREAPLYRGSSSGYEVLALSTDVGITSLKNWLASEHLAMIGVDAYQYDYLTVNDVWTVDNYVSPAVNHANSIVGYDDDFEYVEEGQVRHGAFKIANSWDVGGWEHVPDGYYWISYKAMKQRVTYCFFYQDRIDYEPSLLASFRMDHSRRGECDILIGMGNSNDPVAAKSFSDPIKGGSLPFCSNNIVMDITEFEDAVSTAINQSFFMRVYDRGEPYARSGTHYWYSDGTPNSWFSFYQTFEIPESGATLNFWSYYEIEEDWDYGYVEAYDVNTDEWFTLQGLSTVSTLPNRQDNPNCPPEHEPTAYYDAGKWNAFTGFSDVLYEEEMDLTLFAGHSVDLYFTYWTDSYVLERGWYVDDIGIPEIGFFDDVESGLDGWAIFGGWYIDTSIVERVNGTVLSFSIEHYQNYSSGSLEALSMSRDVPVDTEDLTYVFAFAIAGDVDGDDSVDYDDLVMMAEAYGSRLGGSDYEPYADFDKDGDVNCRDLIILGRNYGKTAV